MEARRPHPPETRRAVEALLTDTALSMQAIAARMGLPYDTVRDWNSRMLVPARIGRRHVLPSLAALDMALRVHIGRQIAVFEQGLREPGLAHDSGRVLRDLAGLKRLLRELGAAATPPSSEGGADGAFPTDIVAFRAEIARRYAAFEAAEAERAVSGEPAAGPAQAPWG